VSDSHENNPLPPSRDTAPESKGSPIIPKSPTAALRPEKVPAKPKRSRNAKSQLVIFLNFLMTLAVMLCIAAIGVFYYMVTSFEEPGSQTTNTNFIVRSGAGLNEISTSLERVGLISNARVFRYMTNSFLNAGDTLKAGEYEVKAGSSMKSIMELLESGKSILYSVSFPEGLTVTQMFARLAADEILDGPLPTEMPQEGSLRPDTYRFTRGTSRAEIVSQMQAAQEKLVRDIWARRDVDLSIGTIEEFVTLASIVEKETGKDDERAHVASVFHNRLNKKMRLQSDPTILYGLFGGAGRPADRPIYRSDIKKETPYNTYVINGLPPGPIANPGRAALEAVANPWKTDDLYFVADGTGGHAFAKTLDEHNANVRRWRKIVAERREAAASQGQTAPDEAEELIEAE
jgi:UPF0755 protein